MAEYKDELLDHNVDGITEYDNPLPGWLMAILWAAIGFAAAYIMFYALAFGPSDYSAKYRHEIVEAKAELQAYYDANPLVPPSAKELLAGTLDPKVVELGRTRFAKTCAACHGDQAQGLIGPNLTDDRWLHGGAVTQIFSTLVKGVPAKGMPPWGRAMPPQELAALVSFIRTRQGSGPPNPKQPEGIVFEAEPLPKK